MLETTEQYLDDADGREYPNAINIEKIIGFDALYGSMCKCRKGVMWKDSTAGYCLNGIERTMNLSRQLHTGKYQAKPCVHFRITSPKPREIASITFRDRVFQRSLNDNSIYPTMVSSFIRDNFACQKNKGTDAARDRLKQFLREFYRKHGTSGYVAQFDIRGYYPNMSHAVVEGLFKKRLSPESYLMAERILHEQYQGDRGYNPGSQLIQIAGISALDRLDHYIKERLSARFYIRYMDDFMMIHWDKSVLESWKLDVEKRLNMIEFELNPTKTRIFSISEGIEFLGFKFSLTDTGKVLMQIRPDNVKRERKKLFRLVQKSKRGGLPRTKVDESYAAWRNHASKGNSFRLLERMDAYYQSLWR